MNNRIKNGRWRLLIAHARIDVFARSRQNDVDYLSSFIGVARLLADYPRLKERAYDSRSDYDTLCLLHDLVDAWNSVLTVKERRILYALFVEGRPREEVSELYDIKWSDLASTSMKALRKLHAALSVDNAKGGERNDD